MTIKPFRDDILVFIPPELAKGSIILPQTHKRYETLVGEVRAIGPLVTECRPKDTVFIKLPADPLPNDGLYFLVPENQIELVIESEEGGHA